MPNAVEWSTGLEGPLHEDDQKVKDVAGYVFDYLRESFSLRNDKIIPCLAIALGMAEGDLLFTNPKITEKEIEDEVARIVREIREISLRVLSNKSKGV